MVTTVTTAGRRVLRRLDVDAPDRNLNGPAARLARAVRILAGRLGLPRTPCGLPLSDHLRRDIGLDPIPPGSESLSSSGRWP